MCFVFSSIRRRCEPITLVNMSIGIPGIVDVLVLEWGSRMNVIMKGVHERARRGKGVLFVWGTRIGGGGGGRETQRVGVNTSPWYMSKYIKGVHGLES